MLPFPRAARLWSGPLVGLTVATGWGAVSPAWLLFGVAVGYGGELLATRMAADERTRLQRAFAFFLVLQTVVALLPLLAVGGFFPGRAEESVDLIRLLLVPISAALATVARYARPDPDPQGAPRAAVSAAERRRWTWIFGAMVLVVGIAYADLRLPAPFSVDFVYLIPVFAVSWFTGWWGGVVVAVFSAEAHGAARGLANAGELPVAMAILHSLLIFLGLCSAAVLLDALRTGLRRERAAARTDLLTSLMNRNAFLESVATEVGRAQRYERPLSLAYLDLDGFKAVNDRYGHASGDEVLRIVAGVLQSCTRREDIPARLGGDEFAVLLPETDSDAAVQVMERLRREVENRMLDFQWEVTCSVGVVTSAASTASVDALMRRADELMYEVKREGKNALRQEELIAP